LTDIPEWAMTKALSLRSSSDLLTDIARELVQARSRAYEECAKIVDDAAFWAGEEAEIQRVSDRRMASSAQKYALEKAATAIRSKANK